MKKILLLSFFSIVGTTLFGQSVSINPNNLQIPSVSALPACAAADYGKIVFLTTTNRANVCSGSGWIEVSAGGGGGGSLTLPFNGSGSYAAAGFTVMNTGGGLNSAGIQGMTLSAVTGASGILGNAFETAPTGNTAGVAGLNSSLNAQGYGVYGKHDGAGSGVYGTTNIGKGVYGHTASSGDAVFGLASNINARAGVFENTVAGGIALRTSGTLRFEGQNAAAGRFLRSSDNLGTASWSNITRTDILKLGPASFASHISSNEYQIGGIGLSMTSATGSFHATVTVPNGSTVTGYKIYYMDTDGVSPATGLGLTSYALQKLSTSVGGATYANISNGTFTNVSSNPNILSVQQILTTPEVINNATTFYRLVVTMPSSLNLILVGAEIFYSYEVSN